MSGEQRLLLVDASVFITLAEIDAVSLLRHLRGEQKVPTPVAREIADPPASELLADADWISRSRVVGPVQSPEMEAAQHRAEAHLGREAEPDSSDGDVALLTSALLHAETYGRDVVVLADDKPLRKTCKALSIPVSGSIGVLIRAVERGDLPPEAAQENLYAMDEVGARLSASLVKRAERMIDEAAENGD